MRLSKAQLGNFIYKLDTATSFQELFSALEVLVKNIGVDNIIYSFIPSLALDFKQEYKPIFKASDSNNDAYIKHYLETRFDLHDYAIKRMKRPQTNKIIAIDWWHQQFPF